LDRATILLLKLDFGAAYFSASSSLKHLLTAFTGQSFFDPNENRYPKIKGVFYK
jgi:hypothetical protein